MTLPAHSGADELPVTLLRQVDDVCGRFEAAWQAAATAEERPRIEAFLGAVPEAARPGLVNELVALEIELRRRAGEHPRLDEYQARYPSLAPPDKTSPLSVEPAPAVATAAGVAIPGYEVLQELGRGGMGVVYRAWQTSLRRPVALKMILAGAHAGPEELARFHTEAEAIARLHHPNIVQVYEVGLQESCPYMALEYVHGGSLDKHIGATPQPAREAAQLVRTLARAIHYAHEHGIVHRDLTPANVLLSRADNGQAAAPPDAAADGAAAAGYGVPKITDFGLAKLVVDGGPTLTQSGAIMGTPSYMAPEQTKAGAVGPATDVYALGGLLYQLLTGRPPFKADTPLETILLVQSAEPFSPTRLRPKLSRDLATIALKCLAKEPSQRYASALALAEDLERFLAGYPIRARPVGQAERLWRWCRRNPTLAGLSAGVTVLALVLLVGLWVAGQLRAGRDLALDAQQRAEASDRQAQAARDRAQTAEREVTIRGHLSRAAALRHRGEAGQRLGCLAELQKALQLGPAPELRAEMRTEAIAALALEDLEVLPAWNGRPLGSVAVDFDPTFERYARLGVDGTVSVRRVSDNAQIAHWRGPALPPNTEGDLRFSPDGRLLGIVAAASGRLTVLRFDGAAAVVCHTSDPKVRVRRLSALDFSPDSKRLAYLLTDSRIALVDLTADKVGYLKRSEVNHEEGIRFAPDGRRFALGVQRGAKWAVEVRDAVTGQVKQSLPHDTYAAYTAWHPDGQALATCCEGDPVIRLWDVASAEVWRELKGHQEGRIRCAFSRTGDRLVSNTFSSLLRVWELSSGKQLLSFPADNCNFLRISPDDRVPALDIADPTKLRLLRLHRGLEYRSIAQQHNSLSKGDRFGLAVQVHPRCRLLAIAATGKTITVLDLSAGREVATLPSPSYIPLRWEDSGDLLTCGEPGLLRWPVRTDPADAGRYRFGPPQPLHVHKCYGLWGTSADTLTVAIPNFDLGALVVHRGQPARILALKPQLDVRGCAVSPDGRWVASASHHNSDGFGAKVWNAATGDLVKALPVGGLCSVAFSPDNRWLLTTGGGQLWKVNSWEETHKVGGVYGCFSPDVADGSVLAVGDASGAVRLINPASAMTIAQLEAPMQTRLLPLGFSRDGALLIARDGDAGMLHVWDLRRIRQRLKEMGLDWDRAELPPARPAPEKAPLQVVVDAGSLTPPFVQSKDEPPERTVERATAALRANPEDVAAYHFRAHAYEKLNEHTRAVADFTEALKRQPGDAHLLACRGADRLKLLDYKAALADLDKALEQKPTQAETARISAALALVRVAGPLPLRDARKALPLALRAVQLRPENELYRATLALVYYRLDNLPIALSQAEESVARKGDGMGLALYVLALAHCRQGDPTKAKGFFKRADTWGRANGARLSAERKAALQALRAEAEAELAKSKKTNRQQEKD